jgi:hypothetical protein
MNIEPRSITNINFAAGLAIRLTEALATMIIALNIAGENCSP